MTILSIIKHIMASASEAKLAAMFYNSREAIPMQITLEEMGHLQPPTNVSVDNSTAHGLTQGTMIPKKSKAMALCFTSLQTVELHVHCLGFFRNHCSLG